MERTTLWAARCVIFVAFLDLFIQFPVVAPYASALGAAPALVGLIVGVYSATNLVGNLAAGAVVDRWGRKGPVLGGLLVSAAALSAYALVAAPGQLLAVRAVHGLAAAVLTPGAFALIGDTAASDRRARVMGINGAIIAVTAMIGPPLSGVGRDALGFGAVFLGGAALMLLAALAFWRGAAETIDRGAEGARPASLSGARWLALWRRPGLLAAYAAAFALTIGLGTLVTHLPQLLARDGSTRSAGLAFAIYALVAMAVMAGPLGHLSDRVGRFGPLAGGLALIGVGMLALGVAPNQIGASVGMAVFGTGFGLLFPAATALVAEASASRERGTAFGIFYAVYSLGVVVGSLLSGQITELQGELTGAPFLVGAALALLAAPPVSLLRRLVAAPTAQVT